MHEADPFQAFGGGFGIAQAPEFVAGEAFEESRPVVFFRANLFWKGGAEVDGY